MFKTQEVVCSVVQEPSVEREREREKGNVIGVNRSPSNRNTEITQLHVRHIRECYFVKVKTYPQSQLNYRR